MYFKMAFIPTRMCIIVSVLFLFQKAGECIELPLLLMIDIPYSFN